MCYIFLTGDLIVYVIEEHLAYIIECTLIDPIDLCQAEQVKII